MTKKYAKKLCLEIWEYLRDHTELKSKYQLPEKLLDKISNLNGACPLCAHFAAPGKHQCHKCPIFPCVGERSSLYGHYQDAKTRKTRAKYASAIVEKVKAWKV